MSIDLGIPRKCISGYFEDDPGLCPECGSALQQQMATYLVLTRFHKDLTDPLIMSCSAGSTPLSVGVPHVIEITL